MPGKADIKEVKNYPVAEVFKPADMVDYQEGAVVSRTLFNKGAGTLTLFAFAAGQGLSEHSAPFDAMVEILDGEGEIIINGRSHTVATGESIIMPAGEPHALKAHMPFKMLLTMIKA